MRALGVFLLVAACSPNGLTIEVVIDDPNIVKVELFAGRDCGECPTVTAPPGLALMEVDAGYIVDDPEPFTAVADDFSDGIAGFRIEASSDTTLAIIVALGYDARGEVKWSWSKHGVDIPDADAAHWQVYLEPTTAISPIASTQPAGTERIAVWPNPNGHPSCLLLEHWGTDPQVKREMLSPVDDFDCDNVPALIECAPFIPNAIGAKPTLDDANCVRQTMVTDSTYVCTLGGPECTENPLLPRQHCVMLDETYCTPSALCQCADQTDQTECLRTQIVGGTAGTATMPFLRCVIPVDAAGRRCDSVDLKIDAGMYLSGGSTKCTALRFNDGEPPLGAFGDTLQVGDAKLRLDNFAQPCVSDVSWEGGTTGPLIAFGFLEAELDNGNHLVVPARIEVKPGCLDAPQSSCQVVPTSNTSETMFACVAPTALPACGPSGQCAGPMCGTSCCGKGETCDGGSCSCGGGAACDGGNTCEIGLATPDMCGSTCCGVTLPCPF